MWGVYSLLWYTIYIYIYIYIYLRYWKGHNFELCPRLQVSRTTYDQQMDNRVRLFVFILIFNLMCTSQRTSHEQDLTLEPYNNQQKKKKICKIVDFAVSADHRIKLKEFEKRDKYLDFARELKKLWNMRVTIIPIVIGAFGTVTKGLLKGLEDLEVGGRVETIQTTALMKTAKILRRVLETWEDLLSLNLQWKTISLRWCEKL